MDALFVAAALISAALHAGWNAAVKARPNTAHAMTAQMVVAAALMLPLLAWVGLPSARAVPWMLLSTAINAVTITAMLRAYAVAGFGLVYPISRAMSVLLVVPGASLLVGEHLGPFGLGGIAMISLALVLLASSGRSANGPPLAAWPLMALTGASTAAYVLADANGARLSGSPIAYGCCTSILNGALMLWRQRHADVSLAGIRREALAMLPVAIASIVSYLLILWVYTRAPIAPASALRDTSALFAIIFAVLWLKETVTRTQMFALLLAAASVPLLRLG